MATAPRAPRTPKTASSVTEAAEIAVEQVESATQAGEEAAAEQVDHVLSITKEQSERVREQAEQTVALVKEQLDVVKTQFEKASSEMLKNFDEFSGYGKESVDALVKSGTIWAKGVEDLSKSAVKYAESSLEFSLATAKSLMAAKTLRDVVDVQNGYAKTTLEGMVGEMTRVSEELLKLSGAAAAPINAQVTTVMSAFQKKAA
jgi:phasin family protein